MQNKVLTDEYFMTEALKEAQKAFDKDEIPVGAVMVCDDIIIARAYNQTEALNDVTAHAEIICYTSAAAYLGAKYLTQCTLYVTLEPCVMCAGALFWAQLKMLVYGASDNKKGFTSHKQHILHPSTLIKSAVIKNNCEHLISEFFKNKRQ